MISSVRITEDREVGNSLFNYLSIYVESDDIDVITQVKEEVIHNRNMESPFESSKLKIEFSSAESFGFMKTDTVWSPKHSSIASEKNKRMSTPQKTSNSK